MGAFLRQLKQAVSCANDYENKYAKVVNDSLEIEGMKPMFNGQHPRTYPSERDTRVVRVRSGDYAALVELAQAMGITAADALHETLKRVQFQSPKSEPKPESHNE